LSISKGHLDDAMTSPAAMAGGGDSIEVTPHDIAIIVGAIGLVGAVVISLFALPMVLDFDEAGGVVDARSVKVGILGSNDEIRISALAICENDSEPCSIQSVRVLNEDGDNIASGVQGEISGDSFSLSLDIEEGGSYNIEMTGTGTHEVQVKIVRQLPVQLIPPLFSLFLLVWGVWRRFQEPESGDKDLDEAIAGE
jgi:hypothetical protein